VHVQSNGEVWAYLDSDVSQKADMHCRLAEGFCPRRAIAAPRTTLVGERERDSLIYTAQAGERRAKAQSTTMYIVKGE
jgi:hypothetical protein